MRHRKKRSILDRARGPRQALVRGLVRSLFLHGRIVTTRAKAKLLAAIATRYVHAGRRGDLPARRQLIASTGSADVAARILTYAQGNRAVANPVRTVALAPRLGDGSAMAVVELIHETNDKR